MLALRKMLKSEVPMLYKMALQAFAPDLEKYGAYPPLLNTTKQKFTPPLFFGKTILIDRKIIGATFVVPKGKTGYLGAIFIDPQQQKRGFGRQAIITIFNNYPKIKKWKLDTPGESFHLHRFYESLGFMKVGKQQDKSGITVFLYEKTM